MQRRVTMVIGLVDVATAVHELDGDGLLSRVARHVEGGVPEHVAFVDLRKREESKATSLNPWSSTSTGFESHLLLDPSHLPVHPCALEIALI